MMVIGLMLCCAWSIFWGYRYWRQLQVCKRRAETMHYLLRKMQRELLVSSRISTDLEGELTDVLIEIGFDAEYSKLSSFTH